MAHFICVTCGTQHAASADPPAACAICLDERQYVGLDGQRWITLEELQQSHANRVEELEPGLHGIGTEPSFAIGQRALLVVTDEGNLLWDCISLVDQPTIDSVKALGGIRAIAISHPHYYTSMVEWARAFDAPVLLHEADAEHVMRPDPVLSQWSGGRKQLFGGLSLVCAGGHFAGGTVLHWPAGAEGRGALLSGDILQVVPDRRWVSFMYSYPNLIPLSPSEVRSVVAAVEPLEFDRIYGAFWRRVVDRDGQAAVRRSAERYIRHAEGARQLPG